VSQQGLLYCRASDMVVASATVALTSGTANAAFPLVNLYDLNPAKVFKATGTSCTITFTYGGAQRWQAFALITHNLPGATVTLTNNGGMASQPITVPSDAEDGLSVDPFLDLRYVTGNSATVWTLTITGASANVAIGEVVAASTLRQMPVRWNLVQGEDIPVRRNRTAYGISLTYPLGVRSRRLSGTLIHEKFRADLLSLKRGALGVGRGFLVIPELLVNDAWFMRHTDTDNDWTRVNSAHSQMSIALEEVGRGPGV